jgi:glycosyltransferase involved in cell wall biosynthesis
LGFARAVEFTGQLRLSELRDALASAHVYVSVPSSDSMAVSTLEAMAAGAFPVVSDLPSLGDWLVHAENALLVTPGADPSILARALIRALNDPELRARAAHANRQRVRSSGLHEVNMLLMERHYYRLAGLP